MESISETEAKSEFKRLCNNNIQKIDKEIQSFGNHICDCFTKHLSFGASINMAVLRSVQAANEEMSEKSVPAEFKKLCLNNLEKEKVEEPFKAFRTKEIKKVGNPLCNCISQIISRDQRINSSVLNAVRDAHMSTRSPILYKPP